MENANVNLNQSACIVQKEYIGHTTYVNICNHTSTDVPWSSVDYFWIGFFIFILLCMFISVAGLVYFDVKGKKKFSQTS